MCGWSRGAPGEGIAEHARGGGDIGEDGTNLTRVFSPARAAEILREIGLEDMTECALRTRAYRKQIPFHLNGHRLIFTESDLREIAEGQAVRPQEEPAEGKAPVPEPTPRRTTPRRPRRSQDSSVSTPWRARRPRDAS